MDEQAIRTEMGEILDQLSALPADAFAARSGLLERQKELRDALRSIEIPGAAEIRDRWSAQAGSKLPEDKGKPVIVSPGEGGGGST